MSTPFNNISNSKKSIGPESTNILTDEAINELKEILRVEIGDDRVKLLGDAGVQHIGNFLLVLRVEALKLKMKEFPDEHLKT